MQYLSKWQKYFLGAVVILLLVYVWATFPPFSFPENSVITVREGVGLFALAENLKEDKVIRSPFWFRIIATTLGGERAMRAGEYYLERPESAFVIAWRILHGDYQVETVKVTIPEGFTVQKIVQVLEENLPLFEREAFLALAEEGYLFPDTYFIPVSATASSILKLFKDNFDNRLRPLSKEIEESERTLEEIVTMASILEGEARGREDMEIVASILWRRFDAGMALQVDTSFLYVNGKTTKDLTLQDLKIDSPYNTYLYRGLPPTPISNPGLVAIEAALRPATTTYLYFLTGDDGRMHYSRTFEEHVDKKLRYIR